MVVLRQPLSQRACALTRWLGIALLLHAMSGRGVSFCNTALLRKRGNGQQERIGLPSLLPRRQGWLEVSATEALEPSDNATVLPVFPLCSLYWPGTEARLNIIDPAYIKMYDDILLSGSRRFVVPFTRSLPGGRVRYAEMAPADRKLFEVGSLLYLTDLQEVSSQTGAQVKYVVSHEVQGRVKLVRLLNPSALFETDSNGNKINYLRAEVEILPEETDPEPKEAGAWREELLDSWKQLHALARSFEEPRVGEEFFKVGPNVTTWVLAAAWQELQVATQIDRRQKSAIADVEQYLRSMKAQDAAMTGKEALRRLPSGLLRALSGNVDLPPDFWEPLLQILAASGVRDRGQLLLELVQNELKLAQTKRSLKEALSEE